MTCIYTVVYLCSTYNDVFGESGTRENFGEVRSHPTHLSWPRHRQSIISLTPTIFRKIIRTSFRSAACPCSTFRSRSRCVSAWWRSTCCRCRVGRTSSLPTSTARLRPTAPACGRSRTPPAPRGQPRATRADMVRYYNAILAFTFTTN